MWISNKSSNFSCVYQHLFCLIQHAILSVFMLFSHNPLCVSYIFHAVSLPFLCEMTQEKGCVKQNFVWPQTYILTCMDDAVLLHFCTNKAWKDATGTTVMRSIGLDKAFLEVYSYLPVLSKAMMHIIKH